MSYRLKAFEEEDPEDLLPHTDSSSDDDSVNNDETWNDWVSDAIVQAPCRSLFDETTFPSVEEILHYDETKHGFNVERICSKLRM
jgi:type I protein arginine methyltransferase